MRSSLLMPRFRLGLAIILIVLGTGHARAFAGDNPIRPGDLDQMRIDLVTGEPALRTGVLKALQDAPADAQPEVYAKVVGRLFREPELTKALSAEARRDLFVTLIKHLADVQVEDTGNLLLAEFFLPHMVDDPQIVTKLLDAEGLSKDYKTKRRKGWERILQRARELLGNSGNSDIVRRAAIRISALCECSDVAEATAALYDALKTSPQPLPAPDAEAYLAAAASLLKYSFPDAGQLLTFLEPFASVFAERADWTDAVRYKVRGDLYEAVIERLADRSGAQTSSAQKAALAYGKQLIAKAQKPEDLLAFFAPDEGGFVELQRAALEAAATRMKPEPSEAWAGLLTRALQQSTDRDVLQSTLDILGPTFTQGSPLTQRLAAAVAARLEQRARKDDPKQREALAAILGDIGSRGDVLRALVIPLDMFDASPEDIGVYSELIRGLGRVSGGFVGTLTPYYVNDGPRAAPVWQRLAVAKALGYGGIRGDELQSRLAALMLRHLLTGDEVTSADNIAAGVPAEPVDAHLHRDPATAEGDADVRAAAIESLRWYPSAATAKVLGRIAAETTPAAKRALTILGRQLEAGSVDAANALAALVTEGAPADLVQAVFDAILGGDPPAAVAAREGLAAAARVVLGAAEAAADLQAKAALVSAHLSDAQAIEPMRAIWARQEAGSAERTAWAERLLALFAAAAQSGGNDGVLADQLQEIANIGLRDEVLEFFEKMGKAADRFELKLKHADIHNQRGTDPERAPADQSKDLDEAIKLYTQLVGEAGNEAVKLDMQRLLFHTLLSRSEAGRLREGEKAAENQLRAYVVARDSGSRELAARALEALRAVLTDSPDLSEAKRKDVAQVTRDLEALTAAPAPGNGKKK